MSAVLRMKSNSKACGFDQPGSAVEMKDSAPRARASDSLEGECEMAVTEAPRAEAKRRAKWPSPPLERRSYERYRSCGRKGEMS